MKLKNVNLYVLRASGRLNPYVKAIEKIFENTLVKVSNKIPISDVDIIVRDNPNGAIPETGVGGFAHSPSFIDISLDPEFPHFLQIVINKNLERTFAHELNHAARWNTVGYGTTLLEAMISEGLADHFEVEVTKNKPSPWDTALDKEQLIIFSKKAEKEYYNEKYNHSEWFFGSKEIPRWTGYTIGYNIVAEYLKNHSKKKPSDIYSLKAEEFI